MLRVRRDFFLGRIFPRALLATLRVKLATLRVKLANNVLKLQVAPAYTYGRTCTNRVKNESCRIKNNVKTVK